MKTDENLMKAFAGESQANRKYLAFAAKAEKEGFPKVSRLFQAIAEAETIHALKHLTTAGKVGSTAENLEAAKEGEHYEFTTMYPEFLQTAEEEGAKTAARGFNLANEAEKVHGQLYEKSLAAVQENHDLQAESFYVCPVCGYVSLDGTPDRCPICGAKGSSFKVF
jgi:rubrerythrin